jgi:hypothetical protein
MFQQYLGWAKDTCELFHTAENLRAAGAVLVPAGGARAQCLPQTLCLDHIGPGHPGQTRPLSCTIRLSQCIRQRLQPGRALSLFGNFVDGDNDILRLEGDKLVKVASSALPEHPASMRGSTPWGDTPNDLVFLNRAMLE